MGGRDRHRQADHVGEHVRGVDEQSEAAGDDRADDFDHEHGCGDGERDQELLPGRRIPGGVAVSCTHDGSCSTPD